MNAPNRSLPSWCMKLVQLTNESEDALLDGGLDAHRQTLDHITCAIEGVQQQMIDMMPTRDSFPIVLAQENLRIVDIQQVHPLLDGLNARALLVAENMRRFLENPAVVNSPEIQEFIHREYDLMSVEE